MADMGLHPTRPTLLQPLFAESTVAGAEAGYAERIARIRDIMAGYELGMEDTENALGNQHFVAKPMRYVVICESTGGFGYFLTGAGSLDDAEHVAGKDIANGWQPVCVYDLDELAGDPPPPAEGDAVVILNESDLRTPVAGKMAGPWYVTESSFDGDSGGPAWKFDLSREPDGEPTTWHYDHAVQLIGTGEPDDRMPVRYVVAAVRTVVVFNTVPAP